MMTPDIDATRALYETGSLGNPDNAVGFVLWRVTHRYQREAERALAPCNLTHLQFTTLAMIGWICRSGEPATQAELARQADIHPMQISLMLKALEGKGLASRRASQDDARLRLVGITQSGLDALRAAFPIVIRLQQQMFGPAGAPGGLLHRSLRAVEGPAPGRTGG